MHDEPVTGVNGIQVGRGLGGQEYAIVECRTPDGAATGRWVPLTEGLADRLCDRDTTRDAQATVRWLGEAEAVTDDLLPTARWRARRARRPRFLLPIRPR